MEKFLEIAMRHKDDHPFRVADRLENRKDKVVAYLHDSIEDGYATLDELQRHFTSGVVEDIVVLSRFHGEDYIEYIKRIRRRGGRVVRVKLADIAENLSRCYEDPERYASLIERYEKAQRILLK